MVRIYQVDSFADAPFSGNPAGVCLLDGPGQEPWMQAVAAEMNLSETAFVHAEGEVFGLRWFTPAAEVELCGHATLATAHILWEAGLLDRAEAARFRTASGELSAVLVGDEIEMDFPATPAKAAEAPPYLLDALRVKPVSARRSRFDYLIELGSEQAVRDVEPDFAKLGAVGARGFIITSAAASDEYDFVSRFFAPALGVDEDPVTGSAHCALGPFWSGRLGKDEVVGHQVSRRGGRVRVRVLGERVRLGGRAVTVLRGELLAT